MSKESRYILDIDENLYRNYPEIIPALERMKLPKLTNDYLHQMDVEDEIRSEFEIHRTKIAEMNSAIKEMDNAIKEKDNAIKEQEAQLAEQKSVIAEKDSTIIKSVQKFHSLGFDILAIAEATGLSEDEVQQYLKA